MSTRAKFIVWNVFGFAIGVAAVASGIAFKNMVTLTLGIGWVLTMILVVATGQVAEPPGPDDTIGVTVKFNNVVVWIVCLAVMIAAAVVGAVVHPGGWS